LLIYKKHWRKRKLHLYIIIIFWFIIFTRELIFFLKNAVAYIRFIVKYSLIIYGLGLSLFVNSWKCIEIQICFLFAPKINIIFSKFYFSSSAIFRFIINAYVECKNHSYYWNYLLYIFLWTIKNKLPSFSWMEIHLLKLLFFHRFLKLLYYLFDLHSYLLK
jgi:hypothetical protein